MPAAFILGYGKPSIINISNLLTFSVKLLQNTGKNEGRNTIGTQFFFSIASF